VNNELRTHTYRKKHKRLCFLFYVSLQVGHIFFCNKQTTKKREEKKKERAIHIHTYIETAAIFAKTVKIQEVSDVSMPSVSGAVRTSDGTDSAAAADCSTLSSSTVVVFVTSSIVAVVITVSG